MHVRQDVPCIGGLQSLAVARKRPLTFRHARRYQQHCSCEFCCRHFFDLRTRTTSEDAASGGSCVGLF